MTELPKYTPAQYKKYLALPPWQRDNTEFGSESDYEDHWVRTIEDWAKQSQNKFDTWKKKCEDILLEMESLKVSWNSTYDDPQSLAAEPVQLAFADVHEQVAVAASNYPHPIYLPQQDSENQYVSALNIFKDMILKMNSFGKKFIDAQYNISVYELAIFRTTFDEDQTGPFGQKGKVCIDVVNPKHVHLDPKATALDWEYMSYIIVDHFMELGDVRKKYPERGFLVPDTAGDYLFGEEPDRSLHNYIESPIPKLAVGETTARRLVRIRECWFKDARLTFEAYNETHFNTPDKPDYDPEMPEVYERPQVDDKGKVKGEWKPAFPSGRCIVLGDRYVMADFANPFLHDEAPFTFMQSCPHDALVIPGDAWRLSRLSRKFNDVLKRIMRQAQSDIERPWLADTTTFPFPRMYYETTNMSNSILVTNPGKTIMRMQPTEIPQFAIWLVTFVQGLMDKFSGISSIMRGNVPSGSQISQEGLDNMTQGASSKMKERMEYAAEAMKKLGYQIMWLIRDKYDQNIDLTVTEPDGSKIAISWENDKVTFNKRDGTSQEVKAQEDYIVDILQGTGQPGAQQGQSNLASQLYEQNAIDQMAYLQAVKYPGWQDIIDRMQKAKQQELFTESSGRSFGTNVKKIENRDGNPGRREKS